MNTQVKGPAIKRWAGMFLTFLSMMVFLVPITQAVETASFGTEDWVPPQGETRVVAVEPPSLGTEDWVPPQGETPVVAMETPSFGTEDWSGTMAFSQAVGTGAIPAPAPGELTLDDYNPD